MRAWRQGLRRRRDGRPLPTAFLHVHRLIKITVAPTAPLVKLAARAKAKHKNYEDNKKRAATNEKKKKTKTKKTKTTAGPPSPPPPPHPPPAR